MIISKNMLRYIEGATNVPPAASKQAGTTIGGAYAGIHQDYRGRLPKTVKWPNKRECCSRSAIPVPSASIVSPNRKHIKGMPFNLPVGKTHDEAYNVQAREESGSGSRSHLPPLRGKTETPRPWCVHPSPRFLLLNPSGSRRRYKPNVQCFRDHDKGGLLSDTRPSLAPVAAIRATAALANAARAQATVAPASPRRPPAQYDLVSRSGDARIWVKGNLGGGARRRARDGKSGIH